MGALRFRLFLLLLATLLPAATPVCGLADDPPATKKDSKGDQSAKKARGRFTISKETTYVTGPLDKDGYIDYVAALNERLRQGVTPENNANVLIWKALGPRPEGKRMP